MSRWTCNPPALTLLVMVGLNGLGPAPAHAQEDDPAPTVTDVWIPGGPDNDEAYVEGETVPVTVGLSEPVQVTGFPTIRLNIGRSTGASARRAQFTGLPFGRRQLHFDYVVQGDDVDEDGISIDADALELNGATIRDAAGNDAILTHAAVADDPRHRVDGRVSDTTPPRVRGAYLYLYPPAGDTYVAGEEILAVLSMTEVLVVSGQPELALTIGQNTRLMQLSDYFSTNIFFRYVVQPDDVDADGVGIPADAVRLNGGTIRDAAGNDAVLTHDAVPDDPRRKVDGSRTDIAPPTVRRVLFISRPQQVDTYAKGDVIEALVLFNAYMTVTGTPQLSLAIGSQVRQAEYHQTTNELGGSGLHFRYVVQADDVDTDGIGIPADAIRLNGGTIRDAVGNDAVLTHDAVPDDPSRKVDGGRTDMTAPQVTGLYRDSDYLPSGGDTYWAGDVMGIGSRSRYAARAATIPRAVLFDYVVQPSDLDADGISIDADAVDLNGGSIRDASGNDAVLDLGPHAISNDPRYKVDGRQTPVPIAPLPALVALALALAAGGLRRRR